MAAKKRKPRQTCPMCRRSIAASVVASHAKRCDGAPLAVREPPTYLPSPGDPTAFYVKLPLAPEVVTAFKEHAANGARLLELISGEPSAADVFAAIAKASAALERDVARVRARLNRRR